MADGCVFCAIVAGEAPAKVVREWKYVMAIEPLDPVVEGHVIVIPAAHVEDAGTNPYVTGRVMIHAAQLMAEMGSANIITSKGSLATQTVFHLHVHIVPRRDGDGLMLPWSPGTSEVTDGR